MIHCDTPDEPDLADIVIEAHRYAAQLRATRQPITRVPNDACPDCGQRNIPATITTPGVETATGHYLCGCGAVWITGWNADTIRDREDAS
jgi:hypothetical protein